MQERGYNFPVLPAYTFVTGLLDVVAIPQNWIVDAKGEWRWTGAPAVPDAEWEAAMLKQLESATVHASPESPTALKPNAPSQ
jgi:hypothetical protein